jgi:hypothetical protein
MVPDFSAQARRLIANCGLEWDERCSVRHETERPVTTSSAARVRRPIGRSLAPVCAPLGPRLGELGVDAGDGTL